MHRGVREFTAWIEENREDPRVDLNPPATTAEFSALEQQLGGPLPADLRFVLTRFNGGRLPSGHMLPAGIEPDTIGAAIRQYAEEAKHDFLDNQILLPFLRTNEESLLAFDRSGGPVSDTWPIIDYFGDSGEEPVVYRTFDGWCRHSVANWRAEPPDAEFTLDMYLARGSRHVDAEPDVASGHATVAHALKRAGRPAAALAAYLAAGRCVPTLPWCDWNALMLAVLVEDHAAAFEATSRLASRGPADLWRRRDTTPAKVAEAAAQVLPRDERDHTEWNRLFDMLAEQAGEEREVIEAIRRAMLDPAVPVPLPRASERVLTTDSPEEQWAELQAGYENGQIRDAHLVLDPHIVRLRRLRPVTTLLRIRREF